ncbi:unnamed protein product [Closterium sp. NIES-54]
MESGRLRFDAEGRPIEFSTWQCQATLLVPSRRPCLPTPSRRTRSRPLRRRRTATAVSWLGTFLLLLPPMWLTVHWLVTRLPDRLATARDVLLQKHPTELTIEILETALGKIESNLLSVASATDAMPPHLFAVCAAPQLPTFTATHASAAVSVVEDTAAVSAADWQKRGKSGKKGRKGGGGGGGGGGGAGGGGGGGGGGGAPGGGSLGGGARQTGPPSGGVQTGGGVGPQQQQPQQRQQHWQAGACSSTTLPSPVVPSGVLRGLHIPSFTRNLVGVGYLHDRGITVTFVGGGRNALCTDAVTGRVLATFTREPRSGLYVLHIEHSSVPTSPQVAASPQVPAPPPVVESSQIVASPPVVPSGQVAASCSCRSFTHQTVLWHHRLGHPSILRLCTMANHRLVSGLPCAFPERYFLVVVEDFSRYTTVFPLAKKSEVTSTLIWSLLATEGTRGRRVSRLHSDRGGEFRSGILAGFCGEQGIVQSWTLPESPQQNGVAERRIGLVMEIARASMIHARAPHFLWPYAVRYATHQLNLQPRVSRPEASPTSLWTGSPGVGSAFRVWGCLTLVRDTSADKLSARAVPCVFLGFPVASADWSFYQPPLHQFLDSRDVRFDESVSYYARYPCRGLSVPPPPLFLAPSLPPAPAPPVPPPPPGPAPSGVSHAIPLPSVARQVASPSPQSSSQSPQQPSALPRQVTVDSVGVGAGGAATGSTRSGGARSRGAGAGGAGTGGASSGGAGVGGPGTGGAREGGAGAGDPDPVGTPSRDTGSGGASSEVTGAGGTTSTESTPPPHRHDTRYQAACRRAREEQERLEQERQELRQLDLLEQQQQPPPPPQP